MSNRLTEVLDAKDMSQDIDGAPLFSYSDLELLLFGDFGYRFWMETYDSIAHLPSGLIYGEILPLFCSLLANLSEEDLQEYVDSFKKD